MHGYLNVGCYLGIFGVCLKTAGPGVVRLHENLSFCLKRNIISSPHDFIDKFENMNPTGSKTRRQIKTTTHLLFLKPHNFKPIS